MHSQLNHHLDCDAQNNGGDRAVIQQALPPFIWIFPVPFAIIGWSLLCGFLYLAIRIGLSDDRERLRLSICILIFALWLVPTGFLLYLLMLPNPMSHVRGYDRLTAIILLQLIATVWDMIRQSRRLRAYIQSSASAGP